MQKSRIPPRGLPAALTAGFLVASCQAAPNKEVVTPPTADRLEFIEQFRKIDVAGKNEITLEQAIAHYTAVFKTLDQNKDGFLDAKEIQPLLPVMAARSADDLVAKLDRNGDNKLTLKEFVVITTWLFRVSPSATVMTLQDAEKGYPKDAGRAKQPTLFGN